MVFLKLNILSALRSALRGRGFGCYASQCLPVPPNHLCSLHEAAERVSQTISIVHFPRDRFKFRGAPPLGARGEKDGGPAAEMRRET